MHRRHAQHALLGLQKAKGLPGAVGARGRPVRKSVFTIARSPPRFPPRGVRPCADPGRLASRYPSGSRWAGRGWCARSGGGSALRCIRPRCGRSMQVWTCRLPFSLAPTVQGPIPRSHKERGFPHGLASNARLFRPGYSHAASFDGIDYLREMIFNQTK